MSKKRRRNSRKRKGSCSSKHSHSSFNFQLLNRSQNNSPVPENDTTEKGETDSLRKEFFVLESDEGDETEPEIPFKEKGFRRDSYEDTYQKKERNILQEKDTDEEVKIVTSVTIGDHEVSSSRTVFQQSREPVHQDQTNSPMSTTKVKCTGSNMKLEINEVLHSQKSDIQTTLVVQNKGGKRKEACFKKDWENHSTPNNDKLTRRYSVNHSYTTRNYKNTCEQKNYEFTVTEMGRDFKDAVINKMYYKCNEDKDCCKNCCKCRLDNQNSCHHSDFYPMTLLSSIPNSLSDLCPQEVEPSSFNMMSTEVFPEVPPPHEFADRDPDLVEDLRHGIGSFQIRSCDEYASLAESEDSRYNLGSCCQNSLEGEHSADGVACFENSSESGDYETLFMEPKAAMSRSSFTEDFIHNHKGKTWLRNNSIAILESKPRTSNYLDKQPTRRKTFPGLADTSKRIEESLSRESFSSGTLSSFYMQSFPLQKERSAKYYTEDERPFISREGSCNSSGSSSNYKPSSRNGAGHNTCRSNLCTNYKNEEVSLNYRQCIQQQHISDQETVTPSTSFQENAYKEPSDNDSFVAGAVDHSEVAESGFDEEMAENEEHSPEASAEGLPQKDLEIHVTPPSRSTSQDLISEDVSVIPNVALQEVASTDPVPKKRRGSVMTIIIGDSEQRYLQNDAKPLEVTFAERHHRDMFSAFYDGSSMSPIMDVGEMEADSNSNDVKCTPKRSLNPEPDISIQNFLPINDVQDLPDQRAEIQASAPSESGPHLTNDATLEEKDHSKAEDRQIVALPDTSFPTPGPQDNLAGDVKPKLQQTDSTEKQTLSTSPINIKLELKEHLKPPDPVLKEPEDVPDHWAKRRMLFKESKERSSAGGSSLTSNITEESGNSEDARSMDMTMRDFEDKGFYTETFHSASWIYRGDDVNPNNSPRCLSSRPRPVTLRERTVKISKGMGDYPWGFRIQFSKPIVVTEVDTNGAAEEAGLLVGDYVMSVNGTDVTSVPHSEAADLARQGPDLLTLTIGSDISRCPNTPRPSCRGYLHKRTQSGFLKGWRKRWFVLKHDCCLYYYRHKRDEGKSKALATLKLEGADVGPDTSLGKPFVFRCSPLSRSRVYYFCATSNQEMKRWVEAMNRAVHPITQNHVWVDVTQHNSNLPPLAIKNPECLGLLHQIDKSKDLWVQHYCALKDGCLYFYAGIRSTRALGGIYLHGYTVKEQNLGSKRSAIELKPPSEEFKTFHLCAENATENKRWILAMKSSISKWLPLHQAIQELMNRPPEETRM